MITVSPTRDQIQTALRSFLLGILPSGIEVVEGMDNKVPEPEGNDFVVIWGLSRPRLATNIDEDTDVFFTGSTAGNVLTVTNVKYGAIIPNTSLFGPNVSSGTTIVEQTSGPTGGTGTYQISAAQTIASQNFAAGYESKIQETEVIYQIDVHGPNSPDNVQIITTLFRDQFAVDFLQSQNSSVTPLYTSDPRFVPFADAEQNIEERWIIEAHLQVDTTIIVPQDFTDVVNVNVISVEEAYQ